MPGYRKVYGDCTAAELGNYNIGVRQCAQRCDRNPLCYSFNYFNLTLLTIFESNPGAVHPCYLKKRICSERDLTYRFPSVYTFYKGLTPTGLIGLFPNIYGYEKLKGRACIGSHSSQQQVTGEHDLPVCHEYSSH